MKTAIFRKFIQLLIMALALNSVILYIVTSSVILKNSREDMEFTLETMDSALEYEGDLKAQAEKFTRAASLNNSRLTIIRPDGVVEADTGVRDASELDNHMQREEIQEALQDGVGDARRRSKTLGQEMLYVAIQSSYSDCILRLAVPYTGMREYTIMLLPAILLSFTVALIGSVLEADRFSQSITKPLLEISREMIKVNGDYTDFHFEKCEYPEINVIADTTTRMSTNVREYLNRLEQEKQIRQEFFSNASHELKTPITSIRVLADSLMSMDEVPKELYQEFMGDISDEIDRESKIIDDLLTLVRMDKSSAEINITQTNINALVEMILKRLRPIARRRNIELIFESIREVTADIDEVKFSLAVNNLVENAVKYNREDGWVRVTLDADHKFFYIKVSDSGIGIPEEYKERVFERFYRVDKARSRETGGTGLGLAITKSVIFMHHGSIQVESKEDIGTTFTVKIPLMYIPSTGKEKP